MQDITSQKLSKEGEACLDGALNREQMLGMACGGGQAISRAEEQVLFDCQAGMHNVILSRVMQQ